MSLECPTCRKEVPSGRNHVFICTHASMPFGVVFSPDRSRYEWNCVNPLAERKGNCSPSVNFKLFEFFKKPVCPIVFE
ncbi:MAG: hypothetical protein KGD58_14880 [Candidatus Lokiarchaeota archaeon]|nr:hypothetical protein [Candidatus Lokiarchaeota archaeon]